MRKKTAIILTALLLTASLLSACAEEGSAKNPSNPSSGSASGSNSSSGSAPSSEDSSESSADAVSSPAEEELPNWRGISAEAYIDVDEYTVGDTTDFGRAHIIIEYPSLVPSSYGFAYQWDACSVLVTGCGKVKKEKQVKIGDSMKTYEDNFHAMLDRLEDAFEVNESSLTEQIERYWQGKGYEDFKFTVESQELMTVNDLSVCKYSGTYTYTHRHTVRDEDDNLVWASDERNSNFVTYAVDTRQLPEVISPLMITITDDTAENPSKDPMTDGLIDKYGVKMIESIKLMHEWELGYDAKSPAEYDYDAKSPWESRSSSSSTPDPDLP